MPEGSRIGMMTAIFSAGPVFLLGLALGAWSSSPGIAIDPTGILYGLVLLPVLAVSIAVGAVLGVLPILVGTGLMRWSGRRNIAMRMPLMWMLVGGGMLGSVATLADADAAVVVGCGFTGAICALLSRWGVRWADV